MTGAAKDNTSGREDKIPMIAGKGWVMASGDEEYYIFYLSTDPTFFCFGPFNCICYLFMILTRHCIQVADSPPKTETELREALLKEKLKGMKRGSNSTGKDEAR